MPAPLDRRPDRATPRRREITQDRLLDAAYATFAAKGFGRTRIDDVCRAAGLTKGAFYSNFSSLDELFFALYRRESEYAAVHTAKALRAGDASDPVAIITVWARELYIDRTWLLINTDFVSYAARNRELAAQSVSERAEFRRVAIDMIAAFVAGSGVVLPAHLSTPREFAQALVTVYDGAIYQLLLDMTEDQVRQQFIDIALSMVGATE